MYQYHVDFAPVVESSKMRRRFMREHKESIGLYYVFDGMSDLKTGHKLKDVSTMHIILCVHSNDM